MKTRMMVVTISFFTAITIVSPVHADKLADFKEASTKKYCDSIPYYNPKMDCMRAQRDAKDYCDEYKCDGISFQNEEGRVTSLNKEIAELEKQLKELQSNLSASEVATRQKDIEDKRKEVTNLQKQIEDTKIRLQGRLAKGQRCRHARLEVQKIFQRAQEEVAREEESLRQIAAQSMIPHWQDEGRKHSDAIIDTQTAVDKCDKKLAGKDQ